MQLRDLGLVAPDASRRGEQLAHGPRQHACPCLGHAQRADQLAAAGEHGHRLELGRDLDQIGEGALGVHER